MSQKPIVIIGGGPAGYKAALELRAQFAERSITLYEKYKLGGTCLHLGCVPSKQLFSVEHLDDFPKLLKKNKMILEKAIEAELREANVEVVKEEFDLVTLSRSCDGVIASNSEASPLMVVAIGSKPRMLDPEALGLEIIIPGEELELGGVRTRIHTSDSFFADEAIVRGFADKYCFIGGGYIGLELASMLAAHGKQVRVLEMQDTILPFVDPVIRDKFLQELKKQKIKLEFDVSDLQKYLQEQALEEGEEIFVSVGRERSSVVANLRSSANLQIIGDADMEGVALAHYAYAQARKLAYNLAGKDFEIDKSKIPVVIFSKPEIAQLGLTEVQAQESYKAVSVKDIPWSANAKARLSGIDRSGHTRLIFAEDRIVGASIIGKGATEMISALVPLINQGVNVEEIKKWVYPHPTLFEMLAI